MLTGLMGEGLNNDSVKKMTDFLKEKAGMGRVRQKGRKEVNVAPDFLKSLTACYQQHLGLGGRFL